MILRFLVVICAVGAGQASGDDGRISGIVVNASDGRRPVGGTEVVLRARLYGQLVPVAQTAADPQGRFVFRDVLVGSQYEYLPGANRQGVHYPGPRIRLTPERPHADVELTVHDSVTQPNPLVIRRYEITIRPQRSALHVTESILVANPSAKSYVGQPGGEGGEPLTLQLAVPADFDRLTFHKEFFGRRFLLANGKVVTSIPWIPGERELKFHYVLRDSGACRVWERPLDLPCSQLSVSVHTTRPDEVLCNLPAGPVQQSGQQSIVRFESAGRTLPAGHVLRLEFGVPARPWRAYAKWLALLVLLLAIAMAGLAMIWPVGLRRRTRAPAGSPSGAPRPAHSGSERPAQDVRGRRGRGREAASRRRASRSRHSQASDGKRR